MAYPSTISTLANPSPTDKLSSPSHSTLHDNENDGIVEIQTFVGTLSSTQGTLIYDIRSSSSNGGGHVQTAAKGGTGQTSFNKGDILVGQSSSVVTKLAVSSVAGQVLTVDSAQALGVKWADAPSGTRVQINTSTITIASTTGQIPIATASIVGSVLGSANGVRFNIPVIAYFGNGGNMQVALNYGQNQVATFPLVSPGNGASVAGNIEGMIVGAGSTSTQKGFIKSMLFENGAEANAQANVGFTKTFGYSFGTSSVVSNTTQQLQVLVQPGNASARFDAFFSEFDKINP